VTKTGSFLICAVVATAAASLAGCADKNRVAAAPNSAAPVVVAAAVQRTAPVEVEVIGNVEAYETDSVKSQITGILDKVHFSEGDFVKKGSLLFTLDARPYEAAVKQAEANLLHDRAALRQAEANKRRDEAQETYSRNQAQRYAKLYADKAVSKQETEQYQTDADTRHETVDADQASIETAKAAIAADEAMLDSAKVQLSYTQIYAPFDGRTGNLNVKQGNVVKAPDTELITINRLQPIYVTFSIPEDRLAEVRKQMAEGRKLSVMANPNKDSDTGWERGELTFVDNSVDASTGAIKLKGTFPNENRTLWPGKFVRVHLRLGAIQNAVMIPTQALQTGQDGDYVFVLQPNMTVESRPVVSGIRVESEQVIQKGLQPGERVVTEGHVRLVSGSRVYIKNTPATGTD